jgi:hypothetical protein
MRRLLALALLSLLPTLAAAKGPWAAVDGSFANPAHKDEVNLLIRGVDDKQYEPMRSKVTVKPGPLWLTVTSTRASHGGGVTAIPHVFKAEPCMRYLLAAQHDGISDQRFTVIVVAIERIGECKLPEGVAEPATFPAPTPHATTPPPPAPVAPAAETGATSY